MACFHPMSGYRSESVNPDTGKRSIVFDRSKAFGGGVLPVELPCGQCVGCRLERAQMWATRIMHEASLYEHNCFITLTYSQKNLPHYYSDDGPVLGNLDKKDFQDFMKRLREHDSRRARLFSHWPKRDERIRYYHVGEYGENFGRPHYHAILFNYDFSDKVFHRTTPQGDKVYVSPSLTKMWKQGLCELGSVTPASAGYVARYCLKKINGRDSESHYSGRQPEYSTMSRRPGIGREWLRKWTSDVFPSDSIVLEGRIVKVPKYYDRCFEIDSPAEFLEIKSKRRANAEVTKDHPDNSYERLIVRERVQELMLDHSLVRKFENGKG